MSWIVGVGLGSLGAGGADVLGAVVPVPDAHPASATESATAIQPYFITATVYREVAVTAVLAVTTGPSFPDQREGFSRRQTLAHATTSRRLLGARYAHCSKGPILLAVDQ